jgi:hypothetical protein
VTWPIVHVVLIALGYAVIVRTILRAWRGDKVFNTAWTADMTQQESRQAMRAVRRGVPTPSARRRSARSPTG